jgi:hypothetical protein
MSAIQGQWTVDASSSQFFDVCKRFFETAYSDRVQPQALTVCELFGATLAISSQTLLKVRSTMLPTPKPTVINALNVSIGLSPVDSTVALGMHESGQRFLGLAAALVTTIGTARGAEAIHAMMKNLKGNSSHKLMIPGVQHVEDILTSLSSRSFSCGFHDIVATWELLLRQEILRRLVPVSDADPQLADTPAVREAKQQLLKTMPTPKTIAMLVESFREIERIGSSTVIGLTIETSESAAWILAFAQWCFDIPPSLFLDEMEILQAPASRIKIVILSKSPKNPIKAIVHHQLNSITSLLEPGTQNTTHGLISIDAFYKWLLPEMGFNTDFSRRMLSQVLQYAIPQLFFNLSAGRFGRLGSNTHVENFTPNDALSAFRTVLIPDINTIEDICTAIIGRPMQKFKMLREGELLVDTYLLERQLGHLRQSCNCQDCTIETGYDGSCQPEDQDCMRYNFMRDIATIIMDIFALSLFETRESLLVRPTHSQHSDDLMREAICDLLFSGSGGFYSDSDVVDWARRMIGHDFDSIIDSESQGLLITSARGQAVYPALLDSFHFERIGYIRLVCIKGVLNHEGRVYNYMYSDLQPEHVPEDPHAHPMDISNDSGSDPELARLEQRLDDPRISEEERNEMIFAAWASYRKKKIDNPVGILQPSNSYDTAEVSWSIVANENHSINARLLFRSNDGGLTEFASPVSSLNALPDSLIYEGCAHNSQSTLPRHDSHTQPKFPWYNQQETSQYMSDDTTVWIVYADGSAPLRFFALADCFQGALFRRRSCLSCCLDGCRQNNLRKLIL